MDNLHHVPEAPKEFEIERLGGYFKNELEDYSAANKKGLAVGYVSENVSFLLLSSSSLLLRSIFHYFTPSNLYQLLTSSFGSRPHSTTSE